MRLEVSIMSSLDPYIQESFNDLDLPYRNVYYKLGITTFVLVILPISGFLLDKSENH